MNQSPLQITASKTAKCMQWLQRLGWVMVCASMAVAWWDLQGRWLEPGTALIAGIKLWIYWGSWATLPLSVHALWLLSQRTVWPVRIKRSVWAGLLLLVAYSGLLEPHLLVVRHHPIKIASDASPLRLAVVSDIHVGLFVRDWQLRRLVDVLNAQDVDAVVVVGDWTYNPKLDLASVFQPLQKLRHSVFAVLGNHDTQAPGSALEQDLRQVLQRYGVRVLDGAASTQPVAFKGWHISGLSDIWSGDPRAEIARRPQSAWAAAQGCHIVLAHNPDTAAMLPAGSATLIISGHTHGGQIMLPWITRNWVLPGMSKEGWYAGTYPTSAGTLFVSAGTGTIGLPARLGLVPRIDVLELGQEAALPQ